jgi:hypothetical protein
MKHFLATALYSVILIPAFSQSIFVQTGGTIHTQTGAIVTLQNINLVNNGTITDNGTFIFNGSSLQSISGSGTTTFNNLTISNSAGVELGKNISINNQLLFTAGLFNIKNHTVLMGPAATVSGESETNRITGIAGGYIEITVPVAASATVNPGNLGLTITPSADMGNVTVRRGHDAQTITPASRPSIERYFDIIPTNNSALNATVTFNYFDAELNSRNEPLLSFWNSPDNTTWTAANFSNRNTATNFVQLTAVNTFPKRWTLTDQQFATGIFEITGNSNVLKLWPNPATKYVPVYLQVSANKKAKAVVMIVDASGRTVSMQAISLLNGVNTIQINQTPLAKGNYTLLLKAEDGSSSTINFIQL